MPPPNEVKALLFDVFGTCVDWRNAVAREAASVAKAMGLDVDGFAFADAWRANYQPSLERVRSGASPWTILDVLHRATLEQLLQRYGMTRLAEAERDHLNRIWHRLDPWPDVVAGLARLKTRFIIAPLSNGNVALLTNMAKRAGLPWDLNLSCEVMRAYKPQPRSYLGAVELLGLKPAQAMMVAAHNGDLRQARALGLATAMVPRPSEYGPQQTTDLKPDGAWDIVARDFVELAERLGA
jgi:2-haloacid dehalogenase